MFIALIRAFTSRLLQFAKLKCCLQISSWFPIFIGGEAFFISLHSRTSSRRYCHRAGGEGWAINPPIRSDRRITDIKASAVLTRELSSPTGCCCCSCCLSSRAQSLRLGWGGRASMELIQRRTSFADSVYVAKVCLSAGWVTAGALDSIASTSLHGSCPPAAKRMRYFTGSWDAQRGSLRVTPSTACVRPFDQRRLETDDTHHVRVTSVTLTCSIERWTTLTGLERWTEWCVTVNCRQTCSVEWWNDRIQRQIDGWIDRWAASGTRQSEYEETMHPDSASNRDAQSLSQQRHLVNVSWSAVAVLATQTCLLI